MQEEGTGVDNNAAASATFTEHSSPHHSTHRDDATGDQNLSEITSNEEVPEQAGNRKSGSGYESLDPGEVEEARMRAQQPSVYVGLQRDKVEDLYSLPKKKKNC